MALTIQERIKDPRWAATKRTSTRNISHYTLIKLAKFYGVTADYLLGLTETRNHPNAELADLRLSDEMIDLLKSGRIDTALLCELAAHPDFVKLLADIQIYVGYRRHADTEPERIGRRGEG